MTDPLDVTARDMIRKAETERDIALGRVRLLEAQLEAVKRREADLLAELKPAADPDQARQEFVDRFVARVWSVALDDIHSDEGPNLDSLKQWMLYHLERQTKNGDLP